MSAEENQIILKAKQGNMAAFEELIYKYDKHVLSIAYNFRFNREDAKDIYQEVFLRVFRGLNNFEGKSEFSTWLYRIVTNVCISFKRSQKKHEYASIYQEFNDEDKPNSISNSFAEETRIDEQFIGNEITNKIWQAVDTLSPQQKLAFTYKYLHERKIKEIALIMNCTESAIKKYLFIASRKIREKLKHLL
jgi:RNA polymerase sigma-70 factor (ECF subfamily)